MKKPYLLPVLLAILASLCLAFSGAGTSEGRQAAGFYYTDSADFVRDFRTVDFGTMAPKVFEDSLRKALIYAANDYCIRDHNFAYFYQWGLPFATRKKIYVNAEGEESPEVREIVPVEDRVAKTKWIRERPGEVSYICLLEMLSAKRMETDFNRFYQRYKRIIHKVVTKEVYDKNYSKLVEKLLAAYEDLEAEPQRYEKMSRIMESHWWYTKDVSNHYDLSDFYSAMEENGIISDRSRAVMKRNENPNETVYSNRHIVIWAYSFWGRREAEGKKNEIVRLLRTIQSDYRNMR